MTTRTEPRVGERVYALGGKHAGRIGRFIGRDVDGGAFIEYHGRVLWVAGVRRLGATVRREASWA